MIVCVAFIVFYANATLFSRLAAVRTSGYEKKIALMPFAQPQRLKIK